MYNLVKLVVVMQVWSVELKNELTSWSALHTTKAESPNSSCEAFKPPELVGGPWLDDAEALDRGGDDPEDNLRLPRVWVGIMEQREIVGVEGLRRAFRKKALSFLSFRCLVGTETTQEEFVAAWGRQNED